MSNASKAQARVEAAIKEVSSCSVELNRSIATAVGFLVTGKTTDVQEVLQGMQRLPASLSEAARNLALARRELIEIQSVKVHLDNEVRSLRQKLAKAEENLEDSLLSNCSEAETVSQGTSTEESQGLQTHETSS